MDGANGSETFDNLPDAMKAAGGKSRSKKSFSTLPYSYLSDEAQRTGKSPGQLAEEFGYTVTAEYGWREREQIPQVVGMLIKARKALDKERAVAANGGAKTVLFVGELKPNVSKEVAQGILDSVFDSLRTLEL